MQPRFPFICIFSICTCIFILICTLRLTLILIRSSFNRGRHVQKRSGGVIIPSSRLSVPYIACLQDKYEDRDNLQINMRMGMHMQKEMQMKMKSNRVGKLHLVTKAPPHTGGSTSHKV